jgi:hypothetical protein
MSEGLKPTMHSTVSERLNKQLEEGGNTYTNFAIKNKIRTDAVTLTAAGRLRVHVQCIYGSFKDAVSTSDYTASNYTMIIVEATCRGFI